MLFHSTRRKHINEDDLEQIGTLMAIPRLKVDDHSDVELHNQMIREETLRLKRIRFQNGDVRRDTDGNAVESASCAPGAGTAVASDTAFLHVYTENDSAFAQARQY